MRIGGVIRFFDENLGDLSPFPDPVSFLPQPGFPADQAEQGRAPVASSELSSCL